MNLGQQRATERPAGLPGRLRSFFGPGRAKRPEPRVRYGQLFLPGLAVFGRQHVNEARPLLERADAIRTRRFTYLGRTLVFPARIDWEQKGAEYEEKELDVQTCEVTSPNAGGVETAKCSMKTTEGGQWRVWLSGLDAWADEHWVTAGSSDAAS